MLSPFCFSVPGPMELLIIAVIIGFPAVVVIVALLIGQRQPEPPGDRPTFPRADQAATDGQLADVDVVEESGNQGPSAGGRV